VRPVPAEPIDEVARDLFAPLGPRYDRLAALLSFGQDPRWRRALVSRCPVTADGHAVDVASGTAAVAIALARRHGCRVTGIDSSPEMLATGRERVDAAGLADRIQLREGRAEDLPFPDGSADGVTATYVLRYVDEPEAAIAELVRIARPGAPVGYLDFGLPPGPLRPAWDLYTGVGLPLLGRVAGPGWEEVGRFLRGSIRRFATAYPPDRLGRAFRRAGLADVRVERMSLGGGVVVTGRRVR
jgi:demethylmenaquinone methyltransferase/2-methoxy-6-polyprenyl-1,4-benzoquinol methylase